MMPPAVTDTAPAAGPTAVGLNLTSAVQELAAGRLERHVVLKSWNGGFTVMSDNATGVSAALDSVNWVVALDVPTLTVPKSTLGGERLGGAQAVPVPLKPAVAPPELAVVERAPVDAPTATGA
jgi:hypothetical protein